MYLVSPAEMRRLDESVIHGYGIPGLLLMEAAADGIAEHVAARYGATRAAGGASRPMVAFIVCGSGNNGGDGFAAARKLKLRGCRVVVFALARRESIVGDARVNLEICERMGIRVRHAGAEAGGAAVEAAGDAAGDAAVEAEDGAAGDVDALEDGLAYADVVVDAIFGTGFRGEPKGLFAYAIEAINASGKPVFAVDAPSGLDCLTGIAAGACVHADATLALGLLKIGLVSGPDIGAAGEVLLHDIGIPIEAVEKMRPDARLTTRAHVRGLLEGRVTGRRLATHKGDYGRVLVVTGSPGMAGAGCLAADAALRAGAGLVYIAAPPGLQSIYGTCVREAIAVGVGQGREAYLIEEHAQPIVERARGMDAVAIGPGVSTDERAAEAVRRIIEGSQAPLVIDADALNALAGHLEILGRLSAREAVITPHVGEMARLLGVSAQDVQADRIGVARAFARARQVTVVLKGFRTVVAFADGSAFLNPTGNPGMATAGAGDVLTGVVAAFIGAGMRAQDAAVAAAYLHGLAGDIAAARLGEASVRASDIVECLPDALRMAAGGEKKTEVNSIGGLDA